MDWKKVRLVLHWGWPKRAIKINNGWDGFELLQAFLDREVIWDGDPVTADQIIAKEAEYDQFILSTTLVSNVRELISSEMNSRLNAGILWAFNQGETPFSISLNPGMRETLSAFKQLLMHGETNPHGGYIWSNGLEIKKPDGNDLSDAAIDEICLFSGQWALAINRIAIQEKIAVNNMTSTHLDAYDVSAINWTVTWDAIAHPDWTDNLVLRNP